MSRKGKEFKTLLHFCIGVFLSAIVVEAFYRAVELSPAWAVLPVIQKEPGWPDAQFGYRLRPGVEFIQAEENRSRVKINSVGLRDRETTIEKPAGVVRIGLLGDSIIEGAHVPWLQTMDARLEKKLMVASMVEVLNFAQAGASLPQLLEIAKEFQPKFDVDLFVVNHSVFEFQSSNMFDEGRLPGYRETKAGQWEMGYSFKNRFSVRHRDNTLGRMFYFVMDNSRVAYGIYRLHQQGIFMRNSGWRRASGNVGNCDNENLLAAIDVWSEENPSRYTQVRKQFLSDISEQKSTTSAKFVFAWSGLTNRNQKCPRLNKYFAILRERVDLAMERFGFTYVDVSAAEEIAAAIDKREVRQLSGFGANLGKGHLNKYGHEVRARLLKAFLAPILIDGINR
jgi:hypothetical protein